MRNLTTKDVLFEKRYEYEIHEFDFGILPTNLLPTDIIHLDIDPGYYSDNNSWDPFSVITVLREREMTEDEKTKFKQDLEKRREKARKERYEQYLKLQKEFEVK